MRAAETLTQLNLTHCN